MHDSIELTNQITMVGFHLDIALYEMDNERRNTVIQAVTNRRKENNRKIFEPFLILRPDQCLEFQNKSLAPLTRVALFIYDLI